MQWVFVRGYWELGSRLTSKVGNLKVVDLRLWQTLGKGAFPASSSASSIVPNRTLRIVPHALVSIQSLTNSIAEKNLISRQPTHNLEKSRETILNKMVVHEIQSAWRVLAQMNRVHSTAAAVETWRAMNNAAQEQATAKAN
jgi:hypothetical protein